MAGINNEYYECICDHSDHTIRVSYVVDDENVLDEEEDEIYLEVQLPDQPFFRRLWRGLKYIFGYHCKYGHWETTTLKEKDAIRFRDLLDRFINSGKAKLG